MVTFSFLILTTERRLLWPGNLNCNTEEQTQQQTEDKKIPSITSRRANLLVLCIAPKGTFTNVMPSKGFGLQLRPPPPHKNWGSCKPKHLEGIMLVKVAFKTNRFLAPKVSVNCPTSSYVYKR